LGRLAIRRIYEIKDLPFMKRLVLTTVCALAVTGTAFADGTVNWAVILPSAMTAQTNATQFSPLFGGGLSGGGTIGKIASAADGPTFYFELLYNTNFTGSQVAAPTFSQLFGGSWLDTGLTATNSNNIAGRLVPVNPTTDALVPWENGTTNNIMLVGWSANLGSLWTTVSNELATDSFYFTSSEAFFGESVTGYLNPATDNPGAPVFGTNLGATGLPINSLNTQLYVLPIPEPGTIALAGLGGLSLLLFRRRSHP
jgi:hypothetical protein